MRIKVVDSRCVSERDGIARGSSQRYHRKYYDQRMSVPARNEGRKDKPVKYRLC